MSCAKMAKQIKIQSEMLSQVGSREHVLHGVVMPPHEGALLGCLADWKAL